MERLVYISKFSQPLSSEEICKISEVSQRNNKIQDVTGVLMCAGGLFFQILEGDSQAVRQVYEKIKRDPRHHQVLCLQRTPDIEQRMFPDWAMHTVNLDGQTDLLVQSMKFLMENLGHSHHVLEQYTQPKVREFLTSGINPLVIPPHKVEKTILFSDIVGFSALSEEFPVEQVADFVNTYLEICSTKILNCGGEVHKFIGDSVMASFSADAVDAAIQSCVDCITHLEGVRTNAAPGSPLQRLSCGFGLARGLVIEGNIGSRLKKEYTLIGDTVNTAARLESLTRELGHTLVISDNVRCAATRDWPFVDLGEVTLKGKNRAVNVHGMFNSSTVKKKQFN